MDLAHYRQPVAHALRALESALAHLVSTLAHRPLWLSIENEATDRVATRRACESYAAINYSMDDPDDVSVVCLGVIAAAPDIVKRAEAVNIAKNELKAICAPLYGIRVRVPVKDAGPTKAIPAIRVILRSLQRSDLNLLAAYRKIPLLGVPPATVTYTRANTRAVYRLSVDEVRQLLLTRDSPAAATDRARLETLETRETHLALVKDRYQNVRANVLYTRLDARGRGRVQISAELPLMYATTRRSEHPEVKFPSEAAGTPATVQRERESQLDSQPFLQSLAIYRYQEFSTLPPRPERDPPPHQHFL